MQGRVAASVRRIPARMQRLVHSRQRMGWEGVGMATAAHTVNVGF